MKVDPSLPTYPNWRVIERLIGPGKAFRTPGRDEFEKARKRAENRLNGVARARLKG